MVCGRRNFQKALKKFVSFAGMLLPFPPCPSGMPGTDAAAELCSTTRSRG